MVKLNLIYNYKNLTDKRTPKYIEWQNPFDESCPNIFVDNYCLSAEPNKDRDCALLIEPRSYSPSFYEYIDNNWWKFKYVFTHDQQQIELIPNAKKNLWCGMWYKDLDENMYLKKTKLISMLSSNKQVSDMHRFRYATVNRYKDTIDCYGSFNGKMIKKEKALKDYMFSVVIQPAQDWNFFDEKIVDCFASMAIPIFYGCSNIGKYFNADGIIMIDETTNLDELFLKCTKEYYDNHIEAVKDNYQRSLKYQCFEDLFYETYSKELEQL